MRSDFAKAPAPYKPAIITGWLLRYNAGVVSGMVQDTVIIHSLAPTRCGGFWVRVLRLLLPLLVLLAAS